MLKTNILGMGMYVPEKVLTNEELSNMVDTSDQWITSRTGIKERRISEGESVVDLACKAAKVAINNSGIHPLDIDLILVSTSSPKSFFPSAACEVQNMLGAKNAVAFDILAACSGFVYALSCAKAYINSGMYKTVLIIGAEVLSKVVDWKDRNTCVLFGDGASAMIIGEGSKEEIIDVILGSDGSGASVLTCGNMDFSTPFTKELHRDFEKIKMNGKEVFKFAVTKVDKCIRELLDKNEETLDNIDYIVCHQANYRIIEAVAKRLSLSMDRFYVNLQAYGNTSSASIGIALSEMREDGILKSGTKIIIVGFGSGLTWGGALIEL